MLFTVNTDINNYVTSIAHTSHDNIDIDLSLIDANYLNAYKLVNDTLVLDEIRKEEIIIENENLHKQSRVSELKEYLNSTDYIMARMIEEIMALNNPLTFIADIIKIFAAYATKYTEELKARKQARKEIEELEK